MHSCCLQTTQALASDLRTTQLRLSDAEGRLQQREEELQAAAAEVRLSLTHTAQHACLAANDLLGC